MKTTQVFIYIYRVLLRSISRQACSYFFLFTAKFDTSALKMMGRRAGQVRKLGGGVNRDREGKNKENQVQKHPIGTLARHEGV